MDDEVFTPTGQEKITLKEKTEISRTKMFLITIHKTRPERLPALFRMPPVSPRNTGSRNPYLTNAPIRELATRIGIDNPYLCGSGRTPTADHRCPTSLFSPDGSSLRKSLPVEFDDTKISI